MEYYSPCTRTVGTQLENVEIRRLRRKPEGQSHGSCDKVDIALSDWYLDPNLWLHLASRGLRNQHRSNGLLELKFRGSFHTLRQKRQPSRSLINPPATLHLLQFEQARVESFAIHSSRYVKESTITPS
jgi:hypothetical protein